MLNTEILTKYSATLKTFVALFDTKDDNEKDNLLTALKIYGMKQCVCGDFDNFACCWCMDDTVLFIFTLRNPERLSTAAPKWTKNMIKLLTERRVSVIPRCIRVFVIGYARVLQVIPTKRADALEKAMTAFELMKKNGGKEHINKWMKFRKTCLTTLRGTLPKMSEDEMLALMGGGLMPEIISSVRALENGDEIGQLNGDSRNDDQIKSITDRIMKKKPKAAIRDTAESSELVERKKDDDDPSSYIIEAFYSKDVPFYIADLKTTDEEKLEWILIEKSAFESLTQFAEVYMDIFDCVKDVQKRYLQIFDLWKLYTRSTGKEVKITKRADLDPKTQSELLWIVEGVDQGLCLECGKKCDEKFCSVRCEAAGKKLKCSTPGCSSKVFDCYDSARHGPSKEAHFEPSRDTD
jgi:hypothetical protein